MSNLKCKMCGGTVEFDTGATVGVCDSCGTKQTLPRLDDDRKANLYDRANHFRRNNEYDKAMSIYEQILNEDSTDAESYWSIVLCKYGIEYVEDPTTHRRVPTVNRAQFTSVVADEDYKKAIEYADISQKIIYEEEAAAIDRIQKGILEISEKEEPFDVFICYKETDNNGRRTQDSVLANDLYHQLVQEGFKVFFSRITLEDKLGTAYEPYIFAALNSAKVMVVLGTKLEHFNAVWVKNEWSRYLSLVKQSAGKKLLIPAYRDMDPYDLPEEFSHLQAQDMSKLGFMQDLIRGITKVIDNQQSNIIRSNIQTQTDSGNVTTLLKRGNIALEDGEWSKAYSFYEEALNANPEYAEAYLGEFLANSQTSDIDTALDLILHKYLDFKKDKIHAGKPDEAHIKEYVKKYYLPGYLSMEVIRECYKYSFVYQSELTSIKAQKKLFQNELDTNKLLCRARMYADGDLKHTIEDSISKVLSEFDDIETEARRHDHLSEESILSEYTNHLIKSDEKVTGLYDRAILSREEEYQKAVSTIQESKDIDNKTILHSAIEKLEINRNYKESRKYIELGKARIVAIDKELEDKKARAKRKVLGCILTIILIIGVGFCVIKELNYQRDYQRAIKCVYRGSYDRARVLLEELGDYKEANYYMGFLNLIDQSNNIHSARVDVTNLIASLREYPEEFDVENFISHNEDLAFAASLEGSWHGYGHNLGDIEIAGGPGAYHVYYSSGWRVGDYEVSYYNEQEGRLTLLNTTDSTPCNFVRISEL